MKKIILWILLLALVGYAAYSYVFRAPSAPSQDVGAIVDTTNLDVKGRTIYKISKDSKVEFRIDEVLNDKPFTAVGTTSEIAGDIFITGDKVEVGTLAINARTFKTDSEKRDGAIARFILKSELAVNEFMYFKPTDVVGTPSAFTVTGDLTISGVTKPVTFNVTAQIQNDILTGTATIQLKRSDFNITIPEVKSVASVDDEFTVTANIVAPKVQ